MEAPLVASSTFQLDGRDTDWLIAGVPRTLVRGHVQNNYPLSEFIDATATNILVGAGLGKDKSDVGREKSADVTHLHILNTVMKVLACLACCIGRHMLGICLDVGHRDFPCLAYACMPSICLACRTGICGAPSSC